MRDVQKHLTGAFLIAIVLLGCVSFVFYSLPLAEDKKAQKIMNGEWASALETKIDDDFIPKDISLNFWKYVNFKIFGEGVKGVLIGDEGWLFTDEEFSQPKHYLENIRKNQDYIMSVQEQLSDIDLFIVPVPAKSRIYDDKLGRYKTPVYRESIYKDFVEFLESENIKHINLLPVFLENKGQNLFYKTDTHWTQAGAKLAAGNILKPLSKVKFKVEEKEVVYFTGDLVKYTSEYNFPKETYRNYDVIGSETDLFGDQYFPVVLIGTSYSADKRWGFEGFLKAHLQQDVLNLADEGLGPFQVMENYLQSTYLTTPKPKLIIWEIPERYLSVENEV